MNESRNKTGRTAALVARAKEGDREAYDRLFSRLRLGKRLRSNVESVDVLQEAYLDAYQAFDRFEYADDDAFAKWLCRIIENRIRGLADHFGAKKRQPPGHAVHVSQILEKARSAPGPASLAAKVEHRQRLAAALESMEGEEQEVLLLRFFQDRTVDDIANRLGRSPTAARRLIGRATARLGELLQPSWAWLLAYGAPFVSLHSVAVLTGAGGVRGLLGPPGVHRRSSGRGVDTPAHRDDRPQAVAHPCRLVRRRIGFRPWSLSPIPRPSPPR